MPGPFDELTQVLRELVDAVTENTVAVRESGGDGDGGPGGVSSAVGRGASKKGKDRIGLGDLAGPLARAANVGAGFAVGDAAARAGAQGGDPLVGAQLESLRLAARIPILGSLFGATQGARRAAELESALDPLEDLAAAGAQISDRAINETLAIAEVRAERRKAFQERVRPAVTNLAGQEAAETADANFGAIAAAVQSLADLVRQKGDKLIEEIVKSRLEGGGV